MQGGDDAVKALRAALEVSPNNVPLLGHLADTLASLGRHEEAIAEYRKALSQAPGNQQIKLGLAGAYFLMGNNSAAFVIVEDLLKERSYPPRVHILHARLLLRADQADRAARECLPNGGYGRRR